MFQRARTDQNKEKRWDEIIFSTIDLFKNTPYSKISLTDISKNTSFTRANLYQYVSSKEEIFLKIILKYFISWIDFLERETAEEKNINLDDFLSIWCNSVKKNKELFHLLILLKFVIEENVKLEALVKFKAELSIHFKSLQRIISKCFPKLSDKQVFQFFNAQYYMAVGVRSISDPNEMQKKAIELSNMDYILPNFYNEYHDQLKIYLKGLTK